MDTKKYQISKGRPEREKSDTYLALSMQQLRFLRDIRVFSKKKPKNTEREREKDKKRCGTE
jgi:hypothetical protein